MQRLPIHVLAGPNPNLLPPKDVKRVLDIDNRRSMEKLYNYLPRLVITAQSEPLQRFSAEYIDEVAERFIHASDRTGASTVRQFGATKMARTLLDSARQDVYEQIDVANNGGRIAARDIAFMFNIGYTTVTAWCDPQHGFLKTNSADSRLYIPTETVRGLYDWEEST